MVVGMAFAGVGIYLVVNVIAGLIALRTGSPVGIAIVAGLLAVGSLGGGLALILTRKPQNKGLGMGLMIGWALTSIISAGYCTGLNPELYR
ncbi:MULTISPECIES: hypothetical protein [Nonomuraea]|uniref:Uncharacterized protein n=1 Tax=Nonomuraea recticatena TaxID=46178 RepID=A0ABN3SSQ2_9ACTN